MYAKHYLGKFLTGPETTNIEQYVTDDRNLHTAFIKELNRLQKYKSERIDVVSSRDIPSMNSFEVYLKSIVRVIAPFVTSESAFEEEFGCSVDEICDLLGISTEELGIKFTVVESEQDEASEQEDVEEEEEEDDEEEAVEQGEESQNEDDEQGETRELTIKKICSKIPGILSTLIVAYILRETVELELLKVVVEDGQNNIYLIKSIHQLLKKIITYYGTFITAPEIIVSFIQGIDFKNNTLSFPGNYAQLYEYMDTYNDIEDEIKNNPMYNNFEDISLADISLVSNEILENPKISSISDETKLDETELDGLIQEYVNKLTQQLDQEQQPQQPQQSINPLGLGTTAPLRELVTVETGGKPKRISNPKHNTKYRKKYKKFVSKYIIKKKKNNKKKNNKNNKNKTRKNKRLTKSKPNSKHNSKTLKNKKHKSKPNKNKSNHKSKHNKKTKTNYYNLYKHKKTLKH
jgi:hypothetical protein